MNIHTYEPVGKSRLAIFFREAIWQSIFILEADSSTLGKYPSKSGQHVPDSVQRSMSQEQPLQHVPSFMNGGHGYGIGILGYIFGGENGGGESGIGNGEVIGGGENGGGESGI